MGGLVAAALLGAGAASADPPDLNIHEMLGAIGAYRIGMQMTVRDDGTIVSAHYFYTKVLQDIPLRAHKEGKVIVLEGDDGGVFRLTPVSGGKVTPASPAAASFKEASGLTGTWTNGKASLPVALDFNWENIGPRPRLYADVTDLPDVPYEAKVQGFVKAVLKNDPAGAAGFVSFPLRVNGGEPPHTHVLVIRDKAALSANWSRIFTPALLAQFRAAVPHEMFVHEGQVMLGNGFIWFDAKGATAINPG